MKSPVPYFGGKQRIADQIVATFPHHGHYVEPFAGGLSVLLAKEPSKIETVNDLDNRLVTFWRVLRDRPEELIMHCTFTPHSRAEFLAAQEDDAEEELAVARQVWVQLAQSRTGTRRRTGWRFTLDPAGTGISNVGYLASYVRRIPDAAARLAQVALECRPALDVIADYGQTEGALLYVDPPYLGSTRAGDGYAHEMTSVAEHEALAEALAGCRAQVVLSGYDSDLYARFYPGWTRVAIKASSQQANTTGTHDRTEVLWLNFDQEHLFSDVTA